MSEHSRSRAHESDSETADSGAARLDHRSRLRLAATAALPLTFSVVRRQSRNPVVLSLLLVLTCLLLLLWAMGTGGGGSAAAALEGDSEEEGVAVSSAVLVDEYAGLPACPPAVLLNASLPPDRRLLQPGCGPPPWSSWQHSSSRYPEHVQPVHTFLISFPRSGNSMTRKILEDGTGVVTGSVYDDKGLSKAGLQGETITSNVLLIKHHFIRFGSRPFLDTSSIYDAAHPRGLFAIERFIYIVRNPMDSLVSWYLFLTLRRHDAVMDIAPAAFVSHLLRWLPIWAAHVRFFTSTLFLDRCSHCESLLVRYEDFIHRRAGRPDPTQQMMCFLGYPGTRACRPPGDEHGNGTQGLTYRLKTRRSLFNSSLTFPRTVSYAQEIFSHLNSSQRAQLEHIAGLEMRAHGYWPH